MKERERERRGEYENREGKETDVPKFMPTMNVNKLRCSDAPRLHIKAIEMFVLPVGRCWSLPPYSSLP